MHLPTLRVAVMDAERPGRHPHAERGNDHRFAVMGYRPGTNLNTSLLFATTSPSPNRSGTYSPLT